MGRPPVLIVAGNPVVPGPLNVDGREIQPGEGATRLGEEMVPDRVGDVSVEGHALCSQQTHEEGLEVADILVIEGGRVGEVILDGHRVAHVVVELVHPGKVRPNEGVSEPEGGRRHLLADAWVAAVVVVLLVATLPRHQAVLGHGLAAEHHGQPLVEDDVLQLGDEYPPRLLIQLLVRPEIVDPMQLAREAVVLSEENRVQDGQSRLLVAPLVSRHETFLFLVKQRRPAVSLLVPLGQGLLVVPVHCCFL